MASKTKKTEHQRLRKNRTSGTKRKAANNTKGSTRSPKELFQD